MFIFKFLFIRSQLPNIAKLFSSWVFRPQSPVFRGFSLSTSGPSWGNGIQITSPILPFQNLGFAVDRGRLSTPVVVGEYDGRRAGQAVHGRTR